MPLSRPHVLLVGGGHANVALVKAARRFVDAGVRVTLLDGARHLYYSGMTPELLGGVYRSRDVRIDLLRLCLAHHVTFVQTRAVRVDAQRRAVHTEHGESFPYDLAVLNVGAVNPLRNRAGNAVPTKPLRHVERLHAWLDDTLAHDRPPRTLVVVGGGPAGTEVSLNVSARVRDSARPNAFHVTLVHPGTRLMPQFAAPLGRHAEALLRARGVRVVPNAKVARVESGVVVLEHGECFESDEVLWATGTCGHPLFEASSLPVDAQGYVRVDRSLRVLGHPSLLAAGDGACMEGVKLDRSGVNAVKQGLTLRAHLNRLVPALLAGRDVASVRLARFRPYPVAPYLVSTGEAHALLALGPRVGLRGRVWLWLKHTADRVWVQRYQA